MSFYGRRHLWIPDTQVRPSVPLAHIRWASLYAMDKAPDVVVIAGDWWDLPSLSLYDKRGSASAEGRRVVRDIDAGKKAMELLVAPWQRAGWSPEIHFLMGNHENRWARATDSDPHLLAGLVVDPFGLADFGIVAHDFLRPVKIDGVAYSHYFPQNAKGAVTQTRSGAPSARAQVQRVMCSATAGHQQGYDVAVLPTPDGMMRGLIAGSFYLHDEAYLGPLNRYWRGLVLKSHVERGNYTLTEVDMSYLEKKYSRFAGRGSVYA